jgi:hypothetical protein
VDLQESLQGFDLMMTNTFMPLSNDNFGREQRAAAKIHIEELGNGMRIKSWSSGCENEQMSAITIRFHNLLNARIKISHLLLDEVVEPVLLCHEGSGAIEQHLLHAAMTDKTKLAKHNPPKDSQADAELEVMESCTTTVTEVVAKSVGAQKGAIEVDGEGFTHIFFQLSLHYSR